MLLATVPLRALAQSVSPSESADPAPAASSGLPAVAPAPAEPADYWDPPVVTPTGQPSRVSESPSTTFVITGDEVRHAGATTIPEILRRVPGIDVRLLGATDGQIGPRGFAYEVADRVLVMVDGRTAYVDFFGGTAYETLPVSVLDIDRIEVVLGPGASVYGNKAMLGTLNIITRSASAFPGFEARVEAGPPGDLRAAMRDGMVFGNWRARITGLFRTVTPYPVDNLPMNPLGPPPYLMDSFTKASPLGGGTASIGYAPSPEIEVSLEAGLTTGETYLLPTGSVIYPFNSTFGYGRADGRFGLGGPGSPYGELHLKAVWNFGSIRALQQPPGPVFPGPDVATGTVILLNSHFQTPYLEGSHEFAYRVGEIGMQARWGGELRLNTLHSSITTDETPIWNVAGFASNEAVMGRWRATLGLRIDHQTLIANNYTVSPRVSVVFSPMPGHQLRAAFNEGYNNPSLIEYFAKFDLGPTHLQGNHTNLIPERIYYGELAYGGTIVSWLRLFANAFAYEMTNSIALVQISTDPNGIPNLQWQSSRFPAYAFGGETGFEVAPNRTVSGYAHYAYLNLRGGPYSQPGVSTSEPSNLGSPVNKITAGIRLDLPRRIYLTADGQYFGRTAVARLNDTGIPTPGSMPPAYPVYATGDIGAYVMLH
ncbi:MAG TPA: TonB-dependent receptor, partial [Polyangia bacterium]|nr:TonB-dependent receptor [Polyangia bacterium]